MMLRTKERAYLIADACNNFQADYDHACQLMDVALEAGWDCIKYQMRLRPDRLTPDQHYRLFERAKDHGIDYLCTIFDPEGFTILSAFPVEQWKIPSGELTNHALLAQCAQTGQRVFLSTGMSSGQEVRQALNVLEEHSTDHVLMQCTSIYPTPYECCDLNVVHAYWLKTPQVGLSDHTPTIWTMLGAYPLHARYFEKHITLDRNQDGPDHASSLEPNQMHEARQALDALALALGARRKRLHPQEIEKAVHHKFGARPDTGGTP